MDRYIATVVGPEGRDAILAVREEIERRIGTLDEGWARGYLAVLSDDVARVIGEPLRHASAGPLLPPTGTAAPLRRGS